MHSKEQEITWSELQTRCLNSKPSAKMLDFHLNKSTKLHNLKQSVWHIRRKAPRCFDNYGHWNIRNKDRISKMFLIRELIKKPPLSIANFDRPTSATPNRCLSLKKCTLLTAAVVKERRGENMSVWSIRDLTRRRCYRGQDWHHSESRAISNSAQGDDQQISWHQ